MVDLLPISKVQLASSYLRQIYVILSSGLAKQLLKRKLDVELMMTEQRYVQWKGCQKKALNLLSHQIIALLQELFFIVVQKFDNCSYSEFGNNFCAC